MGHGTNQENAYGHRSDDETGHRTFLHGIFPQSRDIATAVEPTAGPRAIRKSWYPVFLDGRFVGIGSIPEAVFYPAGGRLQQYSQLASVKENCEFMYFWNCRRRDRVPGYAPPTSPTLSSMSPSASR